MRHNVHDTYVEDGRKLISSLYGSKIGSMTRTNLVSPVPSMGGERCNTVVFGCFGQRVPRSIMGEPVGAVNILLGSLPLRLVPYCVPVPRYVHKRRVVIASTWNLRQALVVTRSSLKRTRDVGITSQKICVSAVISSISH